MDKRNRLLTVIPVVGQDVERPALNAVLSGAMRRREPDGVLYALVEHAVVVRARRLCPDQRRDPEGHLYAVLVAAARLTRPLFDLACALAAEIVEEAARAGVAAGRVGFETP